MVTVAIAMLHGSSRTLARCHTMSRWVDLQTRVRMDVVSVFMSQPSKGRQGIIHDSAKVIT